MGHDCLAQVVIEEVGRLRGVLRELGGDGILAMTKGRRHGYNISTEYQSSFNI